jgi:hypothetical protein
MELTDDQRAELAAIRERAVPAWNQQQYQLDARPEGKQRLDGWQAKLDALASAWRKLDGETQQQLLVTIVREWTDDDHPGVPDLARIIEEMKAGVVLPSGQRELPGFRAAVLYLWDLWCRTQLGGDVEVAPAVRPLAALIASTYGLSEADAQRRVGHKLRGLAKDGWLPRRPTAREEVKGATLRPFA